MKMQKMSLGVVYGLVSGILLNLIVTRGKYVQVRKSRTRRSPLRHLITHDLTEREAFVASAAFGFSFYIAGQGFLLYFYQ